MSNNIETFILNKFEALAKEHQELSISDVLDISNDILNFIKSNPNIASSKKLACDAQKKLNILIKSNVESLKQCDEDLKTEYKETIEQLELIPKTGEDFAERIISASENIFKEASKKDGINTDSIKKNTQAIFEACNFHDITSQVVVGSVNVLKKTLPLINNICDNQKLLLKKRSINYDQSLLNGPNLKNDKQSQNDIDDLFDNL